MQAPTVLPSTAAEYEGGSDWTARHIASLIAAQPPATSQRRRSRRSEMSRKLKGLFAAALALAALTALTANAHAADEFRCSIALSECRGKLLTDGTGTTAHQVFIIRNTTGGSASFTCESLRGLASITSGTDINLKWSRPNEDREALDNCKIGGSPGVVWHMNDCEYTFTAGASGNAAAGTSDQAELHLLCPVGESIEMTIPESECVFKIGAQTLGGNAEKGGIGYHTVEEGTANETITVTMNIKKMAVTSNGKCAALVEGTLTGEITTGNLLLTAQTASGVMAKAAFD